MELFAAIAALAGLVWGSWFLARGGLLAACGVALVTGSLFGGPFFEIKVPPIPITIDRIVMAGLWGMFVVSARFGWTAHKPIGKTDIILLGLMAALTVNIFTHDWQENSFLPVSRFLFFYVLPVALYWVARQIPMTDQRLYPFLAATAAFGVYLAVTAFAETREWTFMIFPTYISSPTFIEFLGRGRGPFLNPVGNGMVMSICLAAAGLCWPRARLVGRGLIVASCLVILLGLYCTLTRCVWIAGLLSLMLVVGLQMPRRWRMPLAGAVAIAGTVVLATQWENLLAFKRDKKLSSAETKDSVILRPLLAQVAWNMFRDHPITGVGFAHYLEHNTDYANDRSYEAPLAKAKPYVQHNVWLSLLTETGLIGVTLFTLLMIHWLRTGWQLYQTRAAPLWARHVGLLFVAAFLSYFPNAMFHDMAIVPMSSMFLFFFAGLSEGVAYQVSVAQRQATSSNRATARFNPTAATPALGLSPG